LFTSDNNFLSPGSFEETISQWHIFIEFSKAFQLLLTIFIGLRFLDHSWAFRLSDNKSGSGCLDSLFFKISPNFCSLLVSFSFSQNDCSFTLRSGISKMLNIFSVDNSYIFSLVCCDNLKFSFGFHFNFCLMLMDVFQNDFILLTHEYLEVISFQLEMNFIL